MTDNTLTKTIHTLTININGINNENKRNEFYQILNQKIRHNFYTRNSY